MTRWRRCWESWSRTHEQGQPRWGWFTPSPMATPHCFLSASRGGAMSQVCRFRRVRFRLHLSNTRSRQAWIGGIPRGGYTVDNVRLVYTCVNFGMGQWGQEVYLHCARAAVEYDRAVQVDSDLGATPSFEQVRKKPVSDAEWHARQRDRIDAAKAIAKNLTGDELSRQRRHIASLKRNLTLGPKGLSRAGKRAAGSRAVRETEAG